jgi:hypothetical protein
MTALQTLIVDSTTERSEHLIAEYLGKFPTDHPIRKYLTKYPELAARVPNTPPCASAADALRKIRSASITKEEPWQMAIADAIRDEVDGPHNSEPSIADKRVARAMALTQTPRGQAALARQRCGRW